MKKIFVTFCSILLSLSMLSTLAMAEDQTLEFSDSADNVFEVGNDIYLNDTDALDLFAAGNGISVKNLRASGNVFAAGNDMSLNLARTKGSAFMAGNKITIKDCDVRGDIFIAGSDTDIYASASRKLYVSGEKIYIEGIFENVYITGSSIVFNGIVSGDAEITGTDIELGENAIINGKLTATTNNDITIGSNAKVANLIVEELKEGKASVKSASVFATIMAKLVKKVVSRIYWIFAMSIVGIVLCLLFGRQLDEAKELIVTNSTAYIATGVGIYFAGIPAIILIAITYIGLPLAGFLLMAYFFMIFAGTAFAGASLARFVMPKLNKILASLIGIIVLVCIDIIPVVGFVASMAADMYLMGYVGYKIAMNCKKK